MTPDSILVVGAGLAGARCAETLRAEGYAGSLVVLGDEAPAAVRAARALEGVSRGHQGRARAPAARTVFLGRSSDRAAARGARRRRRPASPDGDDRGGRRSRLGRPRARDWRAAASAPFPCSARSARPAHGRRTRRPSARLFVPGARLVVVGGGFVGAEVASTALALGVRVTMLEALATPFERTLGATLGRLLADRYRSYGVDLRVRTGATGFGADSGGGLRSVRLTDGSEIRCDVALVGIGVEPARELVPGAIEGVADLRLRRRHRRAWPLDERRGRSVRSRTSDPRPGAASRATRLLLVRPVRPSAPACRPRGRERRRRARRRSRGLHRPLPRPRGPARRGTRGEPALRGREPATSS